MNWIKITGIKNLLSKNRPAHLIKLLPNYLKTTLDSSKNSKNRTKISNKQYLFYYQELITQKKSGGTDQVTSIITSKAAPGPKRGQQCLIKQTTSPNRITHILLEESGGISMLTQNDMLMKKITHAEDENFWSIKEKKYKQEMETLNKKYKK